MSWHIKDLTVLNLDPTLIDIANGVKDEFGIDIITSAFRPEDDGVHGQHRGLDLRCRSKPLGKLVCAWVNARWQYDQTRPEKKCAICHDVGKGLHLHLQVHPNTRRIP